MINFRWHGQKLKHTYINISVISWQSVLLVEETRITGENYRHVTDQLHHILFIFRYSQLSTFSWRRSFHHHMAFAFLKLVRFTRICEMLQS
jgi:hypothetical protein